MISLLRAGFFGPWSEVEPDSADLELQHSLTFYYSRHNISSDVRVTNLSSAMVDASADNPKLTLKAAKTRYLLPFFVHILRDNGGAELINRSHAGLGSALLECGESMADYVALCKNEPRQMSAEALATLGRLTDAC
eukprot:1770581-Pyramimonas_sp.AAC.1